MISTKARLRSLSKKVDKLESNNKIDPKEKKQLRNELLNKGVSFNTLISNLHDKLGTKQKSKFRTKGNKKHFAVTLFKVWEKDKTEDYIFKSGDVEKLNKLGVGSEDSAILDLLSQAYQEMGSDDYIKLFIDPSGNAKLTIVKSDEADDDQVDYEL